MSAFDPRPVIQPRLRNARNWPFIQNLQCGSSRAGSGQSAFGIVGWKADIAHVSNDRFAQQSDLQKVTKKVTVIRADPPP